MAKAEMTEVVIRNSEVWNDGAKALANMLHAANSVADVALRGQLAVGAVIVEFCQGAKIKKQFADAESVRKEKAKKAKKGGRPRQIFSWAAEQFAANYKDVVQVQPKHLAALARAAKAAEKKGHGTVRELLNWTPKKTYKAQIGVSSQLQIEGSKAPKAKPKGPKVKDVPEVPASWERMIHDTIQGAHKDIGALILEAQEVKEEYHTPRVLKACKALSSLMESMTS